MRVDVTTLRVVADHIRSLCGEDERTFLDTLEGETDLFEALDALTEEMQEAQSLADAATSRAKDIKMRADRLSDRATARKKAMLHLMNAVGVKKVERPSATLSVQKGRARIEITNEDDVPSQLCKITKIPDKTAIKKALDAGEDVPGCKLEWGDETLAVRTL